MALNRLKCLWRGNVFLQKRQARSTAFIASLYIYQFPPQESSEQPEISRPPCFSSYHIYLPCHAHLEER